MRSAAEILSSIFGPDTMDKMMNYSKMSASWKELTRRHGIAAAADHSRIVQFEHGSVMVETEHPAWIQLLQTKQQELLDDLQKTFPANNIASISFRLTKKPQL